MASGCSGKEMEEEREVVKIIKNWDGGGGGGDCDCDCDGLS